MTLAPLLDASPIIRFMPLSLLRLLLQLGGQHVRQLGRASQQLLRALVDLPLDGLQAPARSCFFQVWMSVGWTPKCPASSLAVRSPLRAAKASWTLNAAVWVLRLPAIVPPFPGHQCSLEAVKK